MLMHREELEQRFTALIEKDPQMKLIDALRELNIHILSKNCWCDPMLEKVNAQA